jgi:hypothetical protein
MKTREELQQTYTTLVTQLGELEYQYLLSKHPLLTKIDELQREFAEVVAAEKADLPELPKE